MKYNINLIGDIGKEAREEKYAIALANKISIGCVIVLLIASVTIFSLKSYYSSADLQSQEQQLIQTIDLLKPRMVQLSLMQDRLTTINKIIQGRTTYDAVMQQLISSSTSDITFTSFAITGNQATFTATSSSLESINNLLTNLTTLVEHKQMFADVTLVGLDAEQDAGTYTAQVKLTIL